jgi:hypothetical protein
MLGRIRSGNAGDDSLAFLILAGCALAAAVLTIVLTRPQEPRAP